MPSVIEAVGKFREIGDRISRVAGAVPSAESQSSQDYQSQVLHAGGETLRLIDRLITGEKVHTRAVNDTQDHLQQYISNFSQRERGDLTAAGNYVLVTSKGQRFLGVSRLVKRDLTVQELRTLYDIGPEHEDGVILEAKAAGQIPHTTDVGIQVSLSAMPLRAIHEVNQSGTKKDKLAASAAASTLLTNAESSRVVQGSLEGGCLVETPQMNFGETHYIAPLAVGLSAANDKTQLDTLLMITAQTAASGHADHDGHEDDGDDVSFAEIIHMHGVPQEQAVAQTHAVSETGLIGGVSIHELVFWLQGWNQTVFGSNQAALRSYFEVAEILPEYTLAVYERSNEFSGGQKLELSVLTGVALTAKSPERLNTQIQQLTAPENVALPIKKVLRLGE